MKQSLKITLSDTHLGTLDFDQDGTRQNSTFTFSKDWIESGNHELSPAVNPEKQTVFFAKKHEKNAAFIGPISDTCPDDWGRRIIRKYNKENGEKTNDFSYLSCVNDAFRSGALRFTSHEQDNIKTIYPEHSLKEIHKAALNFQNDCESDIERKLLMESCTSLGGARPKASIYDQKNKKLYVAKFTGYDEDYKNFPVERAEVATLSMAEKLGLKVSKAHIVNMTGNEPVAMIERFDRLPDDSRLHFISAQSFMNASSASEGNYYEELSDSIARYCINPKSVQHELYKRIVLYALITNTDDHLKNHGFLYAGNNKWTLSPMFDVNPDAKNGKDLYLKTELLESNGGAVTIESILKSAPYFSLTEKEAKEIIKNMVDGIDVLWKSEAQNAGMSSSQIKNYSPAFEHGRKHEALELKRSFENVQSFDM